VTAARHDQQALVSDVHDESLVVPYGVCSMHPLPGFALCIYRPGCEWAGE
jgi:hypothetical protein